MLEVLEEVKVTERTPAMATVWETAMAEHRIAMADVMAMVLAATLMSVT